MALLGQEEPKVVDPVVEPVVDPAVSTVEPITEQTPTEPTEYTPSAEDILYAKEHREDIEFAKDHRNIVEKMDTPLMQELLDNPAARDLILGGSLAPAGGAVASGTVIQPTVPQPTVEEPQTLQLPDEYSDDPFVKAIFADRATNNAQMQEVLAFVSQQKEVVALQQVEQDTLRKNTLLLDSLGSTSPYEDAKYLTSPSGMEEAVKILVAMRNAQRTGAVATPPGNTTLDQRLALANKPNGAPKVGAAASTTTPKVEDESPPDGFIYESTP